MILVYGATGLAAKAVAQRLRGDLILAGRDEARLKRIAHSLRLPYVVAGLDDAAKLARQCRVLVNCAGPFAETALPLARACIEAKTHYVDISGERTAVERLVPLDTRASAVIPAAGAKGALGAWARDDLGGDAFEIAYVHAGSAFWSPSPAALVSFAREVSILLDPRSSEYGLAPRVPARFVC